MTCNCGCGQRTARIKKTITAKGRIAGEYSKFVSGHNTRLRPSGPGHPCYRDDAGYSAIHARLARWLGRAANHPCADCGIHTAREWAYKAESGFSANAADYRALCVSCHRVADQNRKGGTGS